MEAVPIKQIAANLDFSSPANFFVTFARAEGMRPVTYRRPLGLDA